MLFFDNPSPVFAEEARNSVFYFFVPSLYTYGVRNLGARQVATLVGNVPVYNFFWLHLHKSPVTQQAVTTSEKKINVAQLSCTPLQKESKMTKQST